MNSKYRLRKIVIKGDGIWLLKEYFLSIVSKGAKGIPDMVSEPGIHYDSVLVYHWNLFGYLSKHQIL